MTSSVGAPTPARIDAKPWHASVTIGATTLPSFVVKTDHEIVFYIVVPVSAEPLAYAIEVWHDTNKKIGVRKTIDGVDPAYDETSDSGDMVSNDCYGALHAFAPTRVASETSQQQEAVGDARLGEIEIMFFTWHRQIDKDSKAVSESVTEIFRAGAGLDNKRVLPAEPVYVTEHDKEKIRGVSTVLVGEKVVPEFVRRFAKLQGTKANKTVMSMNKESTRTITIRYATAKNFLLRGLLPAAWFGMVGAGLDQLRLEFPLETARRVNRVVRRSRPATKKRQRLDDDDDDDDDDKVKEETSVYSVYRRACVDRERPIFLVTK